MYFFFALLANKAKKYIFLFLTVFVHNLFYNFWTSESFNAVSFLFLFSYPRSVRVTPMVDSVTLGQVFLRALQFSPIIVIPQTLHTHLHLRMILGRRTNGLRLEIFQKPNAFFQIFYVLLTVHPNTGLFEMIVWVLATCHTQYT